jgi:hypothetical protein
MPQPTPRTFDVRTMVLLCNAVECFAKIAMTALHSDRATMCLLPDRDPLRLIILETRSARIADYELGTVVSMQTKFRLRPRRQTGYCPRQMIAWLNPQ